MDAEIPRGTTIAPALARVHFDGACSTEARGGVATYGFTVEAEGVEYEEKGLAVRPWSEHATNNVAEYCAAIRALEYLRARNFRGAVLLFGDSQLVIRQMKGEYRVRAPHLRAYHEHLSLLVSQFEQVRFHWIPRKENERADELSKEAYAEAAAQMQPAPGPVVSESVEPADDPGRGSPTPSGSGSRAR